MRRWFVGLALIWGFTAVSGQAQQAVPAQALPVQVEIQIAPAQIQFAQPAVARMDIAVMPGHGGASRFSPSDLIVVGRVIAFEPMDVEAPPAANQPKANYRVAIVQVTDPIHGVKKETQTIRVAFLAPTNGDPNGGPGAIGGGIQILPAAQPNVIIGGRRPFIGYIQLQMGQDGIFKLNKHHKENFYTLPNYTSFVNRQNNTNFDNEVNAAKQLSKVLGDPLAALKADDVHERSLAAAVLLSKYRSNPTGTALKQEPIDAEESKLILKALSQSDWSVSRASDAKPYGPEMFNQLGVTQKDGYHPVNVRNQQDIYKAMQTWLADNADKYRIQKFVVDPNAKPGVGTTDVPVNQPGVIRGGVRVLPALKIQPIQGKVQILPVPVPAVPAAPPQLNDAPAPQAQPLRRE